MNFKDWLIKNVGIAATIIILLIVFVFFLRGDIDSRVSEIQLRGKSLGERIQSIESLTSLQANAEKSEKLFSALNDSLPEKDQLISFSKELKKYANDNNLDFGFSFGPEIEGTETSPGVNNFVLTSGGSYSDFIRFLEAVEESKYFISFKSFDLTRDKNKFNIIMRGDVFSQ